MARDTNNSPRRIGTSIKATKGQGSSHFVQMEAKRHFIWGNVFPIAVTQHLQGAPSDGKALFTFMFICISHLH